ncbi:hypothetical protein EDC04DRAFT_2871211 [Pisolithus marmoratus]|nr:hypothetical protein EDC04DRAFT_2871211 [Pisolithus marmoratus]
MCNNLPIPVTFWSGSVQDPLVHHGHHFGHVVHAFCNVQMLLTNGITLIGDELLKIVPNLEECVMTSSEEAVITIAELIQKGASGARADNTKSMKAAIIDWITLKGQTLIPHIPRNVKTGQGFHHKCTATLLCPTGYEWENAETKVKLHSGQLQVAGDQWPLFLYADYSDDTDDPWNGLLHSGLLVSAYRHVFTLPSSVDQEPKAMWSGNARIQQIFPLYTESEQLPSKNSILARIRQK